MCFRYNKTQHTRILTFLHLVPLRLCRSSLLTVMGITMACGQCQMVKASFPAMAADVLQYPFNFGTS